jgi:hypothetical protein
MWMVIIGWIRGGHRRRIIAQRGFGRVGLARDSPTLAQKSLLLQKEGRINRFAGSCLDQGRFIVTAGVHVVLVMRMRSSRCRSLQSAAAKSPAL